MTKTGIGFDFHKLEKGNGFKLGGVFIPSEYKTIAHSDGDVVLHALTDAIFGLCGSSGDIGDHFPASDPKYKDIDSTYFATEALKELQTKGYRLTSIDVVIVLQRPNLSVWKKEIKENLRRLLNLTSDDVGVKAKTTEETGVIGRQEGVCAFVVATGETSDIYKR